MHVYVVCLLLGVVVISAQDDPDYGALYLNGVEPASGSLQMFGKYFRGPNMDHLTELKVYTSELGAAEGTTFLAGITRLGLVKGDEGEKISTQGNLDSRTKAQATFDITWKSNDDGFCRVYTGIATGVDDKGQTKSVKRTVEVKAAEGSTCSDKEKLKSATEVPNYIRDAFPDLTEDEQEELLEKILSIDNTTYDVSNIYKGRVYIATHNDTNFELHKMNELCKSSGGYLAEFDDTEEEWFVRDFLRSIGSYHYFTGANDVESEGYFVYYNSKKPVTNVVWQEGEPNNGGGNENCVELLRRGLNDKTCTKKRGYLCEIPLL